MTPAERKNFVKFSGSITTLISWLKRRHNVDVGLYNYQCDKYIPRDKKIYINIAQSEEHKLYSILHEVGHVVMLSNLTSYRKKYLFASQVKKNLNNRVDCIKEEFEAWERGLKVAKKLQLDINTKRYYRYAYNYVLSYCYELLVQKGKKDEMLKVR